MKIPESEYINPLKSANIKKFDVTIEVYKFVYYEIEADTTWKAGEIAHSLAQKEFKKQDFVIKVFDVEEAKNENS